MKFEEILPHLRAGKRARRKHWTGTGISTEHQDLREVDVDDLLYDDWELVPEAPKTAGEALFLASRADCDKWESLLATVQAGYERRAQTVIAWHQANRPQERGENASLPRLVPPPAGSSVEPGTREGRSLGQIAFEAVRHTEVTWNELGNHVKDAWIVRAQAVRAEVLRDAHRSLTDDELRRVRNAWDENGDTSSRRSISEDWRAAIRKADELRAKR